MKRRRSRAALLGLLAALAAGLGLLGVAVVWQPPDPRDMATHWRAFLASPGLSTYAVVRFDLHYCPPKECVAWSGLQEHDVARLASLAQDGNRHAISLALRLSALPGEDDIGSEDIVLCCGPTIKAQPRTFLQMSRDARLTKTDVVTASQLGVDEDFPAYGAELRARRVALAAVNDIGLKPWRDRDMAALDAAIALNDRHVVEEAQ